MALEFTCRPPVSFEMRFPTAVPICDRPTFTRLGNSSSKSSTEYCCLQIHCPSGPLFFPSPNNHPCFPLYCNFEVTRTHTSPTLFQHEPQGRAKLDNHRHRHDVLCGYRSLRLWPESVKLPRTGADQAFLGIASAAFVRRGTRGGAGGPGASQPCRGR